MAYKYSKGKTFQGDIYNEDDTQLNTYLDWSEDAVGIVAGGNTTLVVSGTTVGIGTQSPTYTLDVAGNIGIDEYIFHNGDANTYIRFQNDDINLQVGGKGMIKMDEGNGVITVNNGNNDLSFVINDTDGNEIFSALGNKGFVGISNSAPTYPLEVGDEVLVVSGSSVGIGSSPWSGKELHVTGGGGVWGECRN